MERCRPEKFQSLEAGRAGSSSPWKSRGVSVSLALLALGASGQGDWKVKDALMKVVVSVNGVPSPKEAGVIAIIPDGGILPRPYPEAVAIDSDGTELYSECVWGNPREGFGVAFAAPKGTEVSLYLRPATRSPGRKAESPLRPGTLLYTQIGGARLEKAEDIGKSVPPGKDARMGLVGKIGQRENLLGNDDDYCSFYSGYLNIPKAEKAYVCTVSDEGSSASINGKTVAKWPGLHKREGGQRGEYGSNVDFEPGFHKVEYAHFEKSGVQEANLCWQTGLDPESKKVPSTIPDKMFTRSASATIQSIRYRDGRTPPMFRWSAVSYLWLNEKPMSLYHLSIEDADSMPPDVRYAWRIGDAEFGGKEVFWLVPGDGEGDAGLSFTQDGKTVVSTRPLYMPSTPRNASVNSANDRRDYRQALLARCIGAPKGRSPCANWNADLWATLMAVVEPYAGNALLEQLFEKSMSDVMRRPAEERAVLEELFIENMRYTSPSNVLGWLDRLQQAESDSARKLILSKRKFQFYLYDLADNENAARVLDVMRAQAGSPDAMATMLVCAGDLDRMNGRMEQAHKNYVDAAERYRKIPQKVVAPTSGAPPPGEADWRIGAVREAMYARDIESLINQNDWLGARRDLDKWEREFPMAKMGGDFLITEAKYYYKIRDYKRTQRILYSFRKSVDTTPSLPDAMEMEFECLMQMDRQAEAAELAADVEKRFPGHKVVDYMTGRAPAELLKKARELKAAPPKGLPTS